MKLMNAIPMSEGIDCGVAEVGEVPFLHEEGGTHHGAVHCDKGQEDTQ